MDSIQALIKLLLDLELLTSVPRPSLLRSRPEAPLMALARLGVIDEADAIRKLSVRLAIPAIDLENGDVTKEFQVTRFHDRLESELLWKHKMIPLWENDYAVVMAFANPLDTDGAQVAEFSLERPVEIRIAEEAKITRLLGEYFPASKVQFDTFESVDDGDYVEIVGSLPDEQDLDISESDAPPIVKLVNKVISDAVRDSASDIHIEPLQTGLEIRFRIDGIMHSIFEAPKRLQPYVLSRMKLLAGMDIAEKRRPQDGRFRVRVAGQTIDLRVSSLPTSFGEKIVMRLLKTDGSDLTFNNLGLPEDMEESVLRILHTRGKLLLVTGPTGSGKTTTLYTCLNYLRDGTLNIETVEDPIEYRVPGINQVQVNETINVTFAAALRSILRQDPDVIMIGEIRDEETADIALQAAQTGHLVLSTLHTNDAPSAISRLANLNAPNYLIASSLAGILAQRLVRKVCEDCAISLPEEYLLDYADTIGNFPLHPENLRIGEGCEKCRFTGYRGRIGLFSYLGITESISELISSQASLYEIADEARKGGFCGLIDASIDLLNQGVTTFDEVKAYFHKVREEEGLTKEVTRTVIDAPKSEVPPEVTLEGPTPAQSLQKPTLLLIEDDADVRSILSLLLEKEMFEVIEAENGQEGLNKVYEHNPAVILVDLMMPVMDGREFLLRIRSNDQTKGIPCVVLTAADSEENEIGLIDIGANDFVSKTASSSVLLSRIRRALNRA